MPGVAGVPASYEEEGSCAGVPGVLGSKKLVVRGVDGVLGSWYGLGVCEPSCAGVCVTHMGACDPDAYISPPTPP